MSRLEPREEGQTVVEMAIITILILMLTAGVVDAGLGFFEYNAVSGLARDASRWASVVGGTCTQAGAVSTSDFCDQVGATTTDFWSQAGNAPLQGAGVPCPSFSSTPADYYTASSYQGNAATTIVGSIANHFDSNNTSQGFVSRHLYSLFNLTKLKVCIAVTSTTLPPTQGDAVTVSVYYPYTPATPLLSKATLPLTAVSRYGVE